MKTISYTLQGLSKITWKTFISYNKRELRNFEEVSAECMKNKGILA